MLPTGKLGAKPANKTSLGLQGSWDGMAGQGEKRPGAYTGEYKSKSAHTLRGDSVELNIGARSSSIV